MAEGGVNLDGWEISVLFVLFMCISCAWQVFIAIITFLNNFYGPDAKKIWLTRLKEEVLDVGVISLALVFVQPYIANICVSSSHDEYPSPPPPAAPVLPPSAPPDLPSESPGRRLIEIISAAPIAARRALAGASADPCPPGKRHLFPANSISTAHYLLFFVALVHIVYSLFTFTLTLQRFSTWARWERHTRLAEMDGADKPATDAESAASALEGAPDSPSASAPRWRRCSPRRCLADCWRSLTGGVDPARYKVLRGMFQLRARAYGATSFGSHNLHYSMICENAMQIDIENVVAHGWLQALIVAIFTLYTTKAYQIVWVGGLSMIAQVVVMAKLQSVMVTIQRIMTVESRCFGSKYRINTTSTTYQELSFAVPSSDDGSSRQIRFAHVPEADDQEGEDWPAVSGERTTLRRRSDSPQLTQANHGAHGGARKVRSLPSRSVALAVTSGGNAGGAGGGGGMTRAFATSSAFGGFGGGGNAGGMPNNGRSAGTPPQPLGRMSRGSRPLAEGCEEMGVAEAEAPSLSRLPSGHSWWMPAEAATEAESSASWRFCRTAEMPYGPAAAAGVLPWARALQPGDGGPVGWACKGAAASGAMQGGASRNRLWGPGPVGSLPAARFDRGGWLPAWGPGPVVEAQDWGFGSGGSRGGRGSRGATRGRSNSASRSSGGGGGAGAAAGKAANSSGGNGGGRINIVARGGSDRFIEPASLASGVGPGPGRAGAGSGADTERGGVGLGHFLALGCTTGHGNPLYDAEQGTASTSELHSSRPQSGNGTVASGGGSGGSWGVFGKAAANAAAALADPGTTGSDGGDHSQLSAAVSSRVRRFGGKVATGDGGGGGGGAGRTSAACSTAPTSGYYGELLEVASSSRFANPLFCEGAERSESLAMDAVEAVSAPGVAASVRATASFEMAPNGQLATSALTALPPRPPAPLRTTPALGWRGAPQRKSAGSASGAQPAMPHVGKLASAKRLFGLLHRGSWAHSIASASAADPELEPEEEPPNWRRNSYDIADISTTQLGSSILLPAAVAERRRLVKANTLYLNQPHLPILDVPPPPSNTGDLPALTPNMASPKTAAAMAGSTVLAAAEVLSGGPIAWITASSPHAVEAMLSPPPRPPVHVPEVTAVADGPTTMPLAVLFEPYNPEEKAEEHGDGASAVGGGVDMGEVELKLKGLFWFGRPQLLLWITAVSYLQNSLSVTLCFYYMLSYNTKSSILQESRRLLQVWLPLLFANLALMLYIGWVVVPLYTLLTTTCVRNPRALQEHIRRHKKAEEEEGGLTGFVMEQCTRCFRRSHHAATRHHAHHGVSHGANLNSLFLANLANQAGVVMASEAQRTATRLGSTGRVLQEFLLIWLALARIRKGSTPPLAGDRFKLKADVTDFRAAFCALDDDCSGSVTAEELSTHLLLLAGTRASRAELRAMIAEIDSNGDNQIAFSEFLVFMVFCFLDGNGNGCVEMHDVVRASQRVKMQLSHTDVEAMVELADPDGDGKIGLRQFNEVFKDVEMPELRPTSQAPEGPYGAQPSWSGGRPGAAPVPQPSTRPAGPPVQEADGRSTKEFGNAVAAAAAATSVSIAAGGGTRPPVVGLTDSRLPRAAEHDARIEVYRRLRVAIPDSPNQ
ncbi:hypothetical protein Vafri_4146 [Volvox africanus]|uniref:EF-hand domain-containing protein n=1 Tax=Volvox africanus TaxID=51714 RepID=A0A8J4AUS8_9CHLO|nr:hypothetical protein Vafri_4146 [Volvox africanus]